MVYTVTLNPAIDYILMPDSIVPGEINQYSGCAYGPGGKGINVSTLLTALGVDNMAVGVTAGFSGDEIERLLRESGCKTDFYRLQKGHSRINIKVWTDNGAETDFNGAGPAMPEEIPSIIRDKLLGHVIQGDIVVLAGSVPKTLDPCIYGFIMDSLAETGAHVVVDAIGETLQNALRYRPFLVKPNAEELGALYGAEVKTVQDAAVYGRKLITDGALCAVVSMGCAGAVLIEENQQAHFCKSIKGKTISTVGAGDSMVAGILYGLVNGQDMKAAFSWGIAAGAATAFSTGIAGASAVKELFSQVSPAVLLD